jgi:hypothetical protein
MFVAVRSLGLWFSLAEKNRMKKFRKKMNL